MSASPRYLTKSRFKLAAECPTKLYYTGKKEYTDTKATDEFLQALAEGGFQVGELAKLQYPDGVEVCSVGADRQLADTAALLARENVTVFEAAIAHGDLFARVDILHKQGEHVQLIEVKAKSFDSREEDTFAGARGGIRSDMLPYLQDIAFQRHVFGLAHPHSRVTSHLMLADKAKTATVDGLNQMFRIRRQKGRPMVEVMPAAREGGCGRSVLTVVEVDQYVDEILSTPLNAPGAPEGASLADLARSWGESYREDRLIAPAPGAHCAGCEFRDDTPAAGTRSGFHECWRAHYGMSPEDIAKGTVLDLWNFRGKQRLLDDGVVSLGDVTREHLQVQEDPSGAITGSYRRWLQVRGHCNGADDFYLARDVLQQEMRSWRYPLHFIDFETARVALPFFAGQAPYANIAFQFSHHVVAEDGTVAHQTEFLETRPGRRPNYDFVRALRRALGEVGTVFMWSPHENTTLNAIREELETDPAPPDDAADLVSFIQTVTRWKDRRSGELQQGGRAMVDLCKIAERVFFHPATGGSCSIKKVLPAVLQSSTYLRERYSQPVYGSVDGIPSLNFRDQVWWREVDGRVGDPYKVLPPVFEDIPAAAAALDDDESSEIRQGGAATTAYARLQFDDVAGAKRDHVEAALKRYCELDTLAMVLVYEAWREWILLGHN